MEEECTSPQCALYYSLDGAAGLFVAGGHRLIYLPTTAKMTGCWMKWDDGKAGCWGPRPAVAGWGAVGRACTPRGLIH